MHFCGTNWLLLVVSFRVLIMALPLSCLGGELDGVHVLRRGSILMCFFRNDG